MYLSLPLCTRYFYLHENSNFDSPYSKSSTSEEDDDNTQVKGKTEASIPLHASKGEEQHNTGLSFVRGKSNAKHEEATAEYDLGDDPHDRDEIPPRQRLRFRPCVLFTIYPSPPK